MEAPASFNDIGEAGSSRNHKPMQIPEEVFEYEVFLSFRGPDTRRGFADYLYTSLIDAGVRTFRDNEELRIGEEIGPELLGAIEQSKEEGTDNHARFLLCQTIRGSKPKRGL